MGTSVHMPFASTRMPSPGTLATMMKPMKSMKLTSQIHDQRWDHYSFFAAWSHPGTVGLFCSMKWQSSTHIYSCQGTFTRPTCVMSQSTTTGAIGNNEKKKRENLLQKSIGSWLPQKRSFEQQKKQKKCIPNPGWHFFGGFQHHNPYFCGTRQATQPVAKILSPWPTALRLASGEAPGALTAIILILYSYIYIYSIYIIYIYISIICIYYIYTYIYILRTLNPAWLIRWHPTQRGAFVVILAYK